jgi:hypothetical protein
VDSESQEFEYPRANVVVSRNGFSVEVKMPNTILYGEGDRRMSIFAEPLVTSEPTIAIRRKDVRGWQAPDGASNLSDADRERIIENVRRAFEFRNWVLVVE